MNELQKKLGDNVKRYRLAQGLSQEQLAERTELHRTYIGSVERGERNISLLNIVAIATALNISPSEMLEGLLDE